MISGYVAPDFGAVTEVLRRVVAHRRGGGAAVAVYHRGGLVVDAWAGTRDSQGSPWERETTAMSFSTTKGVVATVVHRLVDRGLVDYDEPVATYWPEFAASGKERITVRQLLSHSAGLHQLRGLIEGAHMMLDWDHVVAALAAASPRYEPGTRHGYHGITYGFLVGEVIRRVTGTSVNEAVQTEIVKPLALDGMFIGMPPDARHRLAELVMRFGDAARIEQIASRLERVAWLRPAIETFVVADFDRLLLSDEVHDSELPALNGCFTARSPARMYAALAGGGQLEGRQFLSAETLRRATDVQTTSRDVVVGFPMRWRLGYHVAATTHGVRPNGFGHFGFGWLGCLGRPRSGPRRRDGVQPRRGYTVRRYPDAPSRRRCRAVRGGSLNQVGLPRAGAESGRTRLSGRSRFPRLALGPSALPTGTVARYRRHLAARLVPLRQLRLGALVNVTIADLMSSPVMTVTKHETAVHVAKLMRSHRVSALPVVGPDQVPLGIITAADLLEDRSDASPVSSFMSQPAYTVPMSEGPHVAARIMRNHHLHHVVVVDHHKVVGMVSAFDLLALVEDHRYTAKQPPTPAKHGSRRQ